MEVTEQGEEDDLKSAREDQCGGGDVRRAGEFKTA